jgi:hypothetical protein
MKRILQSLFLLFLISISGSAQHSQTIRGTVKDKNTHAPLFGVNIAVITIDPQRGTTCDTDGSFRIENVPNGRHEIQFSYIGYKPASASVILSSAHEAVLEIELTEMVYQAEEVIVVANQRKDKPINQMAQISARSFTVEETERYAGSWGDPARMASNFAGVMAASEARNDIIIRGNSPLGLLWRLEGINVPNPNHFGTLGTTGGPISMLNNNLLRNSDFFTGAFPAEYGNALSGAFDLSLRSGNNQQREYIIQMGLNGIELGAEGPFSKKHSASYLINYRYSFLGLMSLLGINYGPEGTVPEYQDISYKIDVPTKKAGKFSFFGIAGNSNVKTYDSKKEDSTEFTFPDYGADFSYHSGMMTHGIVHNLALSSNTRIISRLAFAGSFSDYKYDSVSIEDRSITLYARTYLKEWQYAASTEIQSRLNTRNHINIGIKADVYQPTFRDSTLQNDGTYRIGTKADGTMALYQGFAEWQHRLSDNLTFYGGAHAQYFGLNGSFNLEPRASIRWTFLKGQSISLGYGLHSQLQPHQLYFAESLNDRTGEYFETTNKNLDFTKSHHYVLGYDYLITRNLRFKFETYYQQIYNAPVEQIPSYISMLNYGSGFYVPEYDSLINDGTGRNYGLEFTLEKFFSNNYYFLITASLFEAKYKGSDNVERNSAFNNNYVMNALGGYEFTLGKNTFLTVSTKFVTAGGNRYVPYTIVQDDNGRYNRDYDYDRAFDEQYPNYMRIDLMFTLRWNSKKMTNEWIMDFENLTNKQNLYYNTLNSIDGTEEPTYHQGFAWLMMWRLRF